MMIRQGVSVFQQQHALLGGLGCLQHHKMPPFTGDDAEDYDEDDDDDNDDDDDGGNDDVEVDDYIAVDKQDVGAGGSIIKLEDAAFISCTGDFEVDTARH